MQAAGPGCEAGSLNANGDTATWAEAGRGACCEAGDFSRWRRGPLWFARGLTQAASAGREVGGYDVAADVASCDWPWDFRRRRALCARWEL